VSKRVLVSGASGFIGGYLVAELLSRDYTVIGVENFSKYGRISKAHDHHDRYTLIEGDAADADLMAEALLQCDHFIAAAALIGGISYVHSVPYVL
jgi:nucleoside-diphosphate-sugar epimerase